MRVPCETPLVMQGVDQNQAAIAHDAMLHSLRRGETRTCHGCHDGHSEERAAQLDGTAAERFVRTQAASWNPPMLAVKPPVTFQDVQPILVRRCAGCHQDMTNADGLLYDRIAWDFMQFDWPWAQKQPGWGTRRQVAHVLIKGGGTGYAPGEPLQFMPGGAAGHVATVGPGGEIRQIRLTAPGANYDPLTPVGVVGSGAQLQAMTDTFKLARPYTSKWVAKFARDSLLYWKCMGRRMDGRSDAQYANDIDYGQPHPTSATPAECRTIATWIDTGIQN